MDPTVIHCHTFVELLNTISKHIFNEEVLEGHDDPLKFRIGFLLPKSNIVVTTSIQSFKDNLNEKGDEVYELFIRALRSEEGRIAINAAVFGQCKSLAEDPYRLRSNSKDKNFEQA